ncbi:MAG: SH3 domain-containing protein [Acholeplasmatales bacterium]|nr:SH3 domain-containing protein [Acholeplasmatales bacterium]
MKRKIILLILLFAGFFSISMNVSASTITARAGRVDTAGSNLNIRSNASQSSSILGKLSDRSYVTVIRESGNWYYVEYKENKYGYVHKDYVDIVSSTAKQVSTGGGSLNARTGPATSYQTFDKIANYDYVVELEAYNYWSKILFEGNKVGYVYKSYLSSGYKYPSISIKVPSYKQYDSRWASTKIKGTSQTIKEIGCLLTSMSMAESYRTSSTITPVSMMNKLSFTSSGNMYWPSNYTQNSTYSGYISRIYQKLKEGKPVLVGAKTASGGQHWVVVYGYKGSNSLSASNFLINDPGSSSRITLAQFFGSYPYFYKIAYYI